MANADVEVVVCGEVLCDLFAPRPGLLIADADRLLPRLGGAPANVAVQTARLGHQTALITAVGKDPFGARALRALREESVLTNGVITMPDRRTGATLVEVDADGERRFFGFREASADLALTPAHVDNNVSRRLLRRARVMHSGTVSLRTKGARDATRFLQDHARGAGAIISVDVNLRPGMYPSRDAMLERAYGAVATADVLKATLDEAKLLVRGRRMRSLARQLLEQGPRLVMLTDGEGMMSATTMTRHVELPALAAKTVDATGAGDAFWGAVLSGLIMLDIDPMQVAHLDDGALLWLLDRGRRAGAAAVSALGATTKMCRRLPMPRFLVDTRSAGAR